MNTLLKVKDPKLYSIIAKEFNPIDDMRASKEYRVKISKNLLERFFNEQNKINTLVY